MQIRRYQVLISLMLSSQTKDEVVGKAMVKLKENGLTITNILATPQEEVAGMIFPVGFWNVGGLHCLSVGLHYSCFCRRKQNISRKQPKY